MPPPPQALADLKGMNIKVQRPDLDIFSLFCFVLFCFLRGFPFCAMVPPLPYVQTSLRNLSALPFSFCLTHETI